ncbi:MAG: hypothetical protein JWO92_1136 [Chitinophagaceae bacterium]|nr:hypothetical protein [Chitinophagaceae bacterium]
MIVEEYKELIVKIDFKEYPLHYPDETNFLYKIINYEETDLDLKIHLTKLILCRSFFGSYTTWYNDVKWFIGSFFKDFKKDLIKIELTDTISLAAEMIMSEEIFSKRIIGTTFMFGIIEFYAKHKLGFRPLNYNFFDEEKKKHIKKLTLQGKSSLSIKTAFENLQHQNLPISQALNDIDDFTTKHLSENCIESKNWTPHRIADRIVLARNAMLHGELHSFHDKGPYLLMLYILFHLYESKKLKK